MFASHVEDTHTNHVNLHLFSATLFVYVLTPIISFYSVHVLCYALEKVNNLINGTTNTMQAYGVPLPCYKDCN
jgi:hypothetical protein